MNFKVGDWIRSKDGLDVSRITIDTERFLKEVEHKDIKDEWEHWKPQVGEWCWFWSEGNLSPHIMQFSCMAADGKTYLSGFAGYDYCEPYIGPLPSFVKE